MSEEKTQDIVETEGCCCGCQCGFEEEKISDGVSAEEVNDSMEGEFEDEAEGEVEDDAKDAAEDEFEFEDEAEAEGAAEDVRERGFNNAQDSEEDSEEANSEDFSQESLSDDELDDVADTAIGVLQGMLQYLNVGEITIDEYEGDEGELILDITGDDLAVLIGRHGKTLDALQTLVSAITARKIGFRYPIVVDVEGYKNRQRQKLESIARSAANRAVGQGKSAKLRPMTPYERRIVHIALRGDKRVETASEGEGASRHVVIIPQ